jgi:hypothetical protein
VKNGSLPLYPSNAIEPTDHQFWHNFHEARENLGSQPEALNESRQNHLLALNRLWAPGLHTKSRRPCPSLVRHGAC